MHSRYTSVIRHLSNSNVLLEIVSQYTPSTPSVCLVVVVQSVVSEQYQSVYAVFSTRVQLT